MLLVAFVAGFVDSIAGGGGLLTVPALSFTGIDTAMILGTNKLQGVAGSFSASFKFLKSKQIKMKELLLAFACSFAGGVLGAFIVQSLNTDFLKPLILFMLIAIAIFFLFSPKLLNKETKAKVGSVAFALLFGFSVGFYDGFFGPGAGTFFTLCFMFFAGYNLRNATMRARVLNFASNLGALLLFLVAGKIIYSIGLTMALGSFAGARLGAFFVINKSSSFIRVLIILVSIAMSCKLFIDMYF